MIWRIIPARAGFTSTRTRSRSAIGDHPRSRGVYLSLLHRVRVSTGIIPARAGFTPRSSTPTREGRIIPARAGFTGPRTRSAPLSRDHPRSRGVYHWRYAIVTPGTGSSPLARGLLVRRGPAPAVGRIIPARAGFTWAQPTERKVRRDHPRSRGVYQGQGQGRRRCCGSSPLARGLLPDRVRVRLNARIIPARAGFTQVDCVSRRDNKDHPRSRGVYSYAFDYCGIPAGSSPLARGLPMLAQATAVRRRIIPARAGFTTGGA